MLIQIYMRQKNDRILQETLRQKRHRRAELERLMMAQSNDSSEIYSSQSVIADTIDTDATSTRSSGYRGDVVSVNSSSLASKTDYGSIASSERPFGSKDDLVNYWDLARLNFFPS